MIGIFSIQAPALAAALLAGAGTERFTFREIHMACDTRVTVYAPDEPRAAAAARRAFDRIAGIERALSVWMPSSEVRPLPLPAGVLPLVSPVQRAALEAALLLARATDGRFDPTVAPVVALWRQARRSGTLPDAAAVAEARAHTGWRHVDLDEEGVAFRIDGIRLDFGGIGKGYAAAEAARTLRDAGFPRALVAVAGDVSSAWAPPGRSAWVVEVDAGDGAGDAALLGPWMSISTSGDINQFVEIAGVRYSHIIDPATGIGVSHRTESTVVTPAGPLADGLATSLCVVKPEEAVPLVGKVPGASARLVRGGSSPPRIECTPGFPLRR